MRRLISIIYSLGPRHCPAHLAHPAPPRHSLPARSRSPSRPQRSDGRGAGRKKATWSRSDFKA
ncbi:hypothetical protein E2C01_061398 [Portunus trituberculatus]|uniref:Uncharacterized protein n=1 Tax=Portunus trituberculatus TaxID=210409 RepID=A0A5B7HBK1_PORTR|nr:hypothetical protein [Portunus trituberculatus]